MESHKCNLCSTLFTNARALGSHMKVHHPETAAPPLPPPSSSSSSSAAANDLDSDPIFDIVLQDKESETESKNPTRKRSKRRRKPPPEQPEPASSVSDTSPEEDLAMCLMMLSRDRRIENQNQIPNQKFGEIRVKKKCEKCKKQFRSYRALFSHGNICQLKTELEEEEEERLRNGGNRRRIFKCPFCLKVFGSGQALGGHKRSHLVSSTNGGVTVNGSVSLKLEISLIDLNLPAPLQDDDFSEVYDS